MKLTERHLRAKSNFPTDKPHFDFSDGAGLLARFYKAGHISFYYRFRWQGKAAILKLGSYPELSLKEAREHHREAKRKLELSIDPRTKVKSASVETVKGGLEYWFEHEFRVKRKNPKPYESALRKYIIAEIGTRNFSDITVKEWVDVISKMEAKVFATSVLAMLKQCARYLLIMGFIESCSIFILTSRYVGIPSKPRQRFLSFSELHRIYNFCTKETNNLEFAAACLILMFTGCRSVELRLAKRQHFDFKNMVWSIPIENSKTSKVIVRPIPDFLVRPIKLLMDCSSHNEFIVVSQSGKMLTQAGFFARMTRVGAKVGLEHWTPHVFRHSIATLFGDLNIQPFVAEKLLGHEMAGVMGVYNKGLYLEQQLEAMNIWHEAILNYDGN